MEKEDFQLLARGAPSTSRLPDQLCGSSISGTSMPTATVFYASGTGLIKWMMKTPQKVTSLGGVVVKPLDVRLVGTRFIYWYQLQPRASHYILFSKQETPNN